MDTVAALTDANLRPVFMARLAMKGANSEVLHTMPMERGNSIAWLVWHSARQMDAQTAELTGGEQVWTADAWGPRLGVDRPAEEFGMGDTPAHVASLRIGDSGALLDYLQAVVDALNSYIAQQTQEQLSEIIDRSYDPPVSRGVRIISMIDDNVAHTAQAVYAHGLLEDGWSLGV